MNQHICEFGILPDCWCCSTLWAHTAYSFAQKLLILCERVTCDVVVYMALISSNSFFFLHLRDCIVSMDACHICVVVFMHWDCCTLDITRLISKGLLSFDSSLTEAFCIAILEAASCGLLTVSTCVGGVPEVGIKIFYIYIAIYDYFCSVSMASLLYC